MLFFNKFVILLQRVDNRLRIDIKVIDQHGYWMPNLKIVLTHNLRCYFKFSWFFLCQLYMQWQAYSLHKDYLE